MSQLRRHLRFVVALGVIGIAAVAGSDAISPTEPSADRIKVRPEVLEALSGQSQAPVIISLKETLPLSTPLDRKTLRRDVAVMQEGVLAVLTASDFTLTHKYEVVPALAGWVRASAIDKLAAHQDVTSVGLRTPWRASLTESVLQINADQLHALGITGAGVEVAVLDTGIDTDHPDLADDLLSEHCFMSNMLGQGLCSNGQPTDSGPGSAEDDDVVNGHGSHVSGIITSGGVVGPLGVAPDAGIRAYKVLNPAGFGDPADIIAAGDHILANYPDTDLVNLSLGIGVFDPGTCDDLIPAVTAAINIGRAAGNTVFASSGNDGDKARTTYPACISTVVSVGAVYDADLGVQQKWAPCTDATTAQDQVVCFSNSDSSLDLLAPGCSTVSSGLGGGTAKLCGTSMATPHAVGVAALLLDKESTVSPDQLESCLKSRGVPITDAANGVTTPRVDARASLSCANVGGVAELPEVAGKPLESPDSSGPSTTVLAGLAGAVAAAALAFGGAAWYARRRS